MENTFHRMLDPSFSSSSTGERSQPNFLPSATFSGSKPGYVFRTSDLGTGYHLDGNPTDHRYKDNITNNKTAVANRNIVTIKTPQQLLEEAEAAAKTSTTTAAATLDAVGVSQMTATLVKVYEKNLLERSEFAKDPERYMKSEVDLHDALEAIQNVAADPTLYKYILSRGAVQILVQSLTHPNADIVLTVLQTWNELLDVNLLQLEHDLKQRILVQENITKLGYSLVVHHQGIQALSTTLTTIEDTNETVDQDERDLISKEILTLIETLLDLDTMGFFREEENKQDSIHNTSYTGVVHRIWNDSPTFISWLLYQIGNNDTNRQQIVLTSSDLLASILQHEDGIPFISKLIAMPPFRNSSSFSKTPEDGIDLLLRAVAPYRKKDPIDETECEYLENILDAIAASLLHGEKCIVEHFLQLQGIELMLRFLSSKRHAGGGALRVLNFCLSGTDQQSTTKHSSSSSSKDESFSSTHYETACAHFVHAGGLKVLFPLLMGTSIPKPAICTDAGKILPSNYKNNNNNKNSNNGNHQTLADKKSKSIKHAKKEWANQVKMNTIYILYSLTRYLQDNSPFDAKSRLISKLVEADCVSYLFSFFLYE